MRRKAAGDEPHTVRDVSAPGGQAVGVNLGTVQQLHLHGAFRRLRDVIIDLDPLPGDLRLTDPANPADVLGCFVGRRWLLERIDAFTAECVSRGVGRYLLIEAEAGMGKTALATYCAFTRQWPTHVTRLTAGAAPEVARTNLVAQLIARWDLTDAAPGGVLPAGHDTTQWLYGRLCEAARKRDIAAPGTAVMLQVDGLDEAPPPSPGQLPLGLPQHLPPGTVVLVTARPGARLPAGVRVECIDVESGLNSADLREYLRFVVGRDPLLAGPLVEHGADPNLFCEALLHRSGGVWIYALSVLDEIRARHRVPIDLDALPPSLATYYANNIARWQRDPAIEWDEVASPLLATLAAAREPHSAATLAGWAGAPVAVARRLLRGPLKAFLVTRPGGDPDLYALRHQSLRELLDGRLPEDTDDGLREAAHDLVEATRTAHLRIVAAHVPPGSPTTRDWARTAPYARAHLAAHAAACGRLDELLADPVFLIIAGLPSLTAQRPHLRKDSEIALAALELAANSWADDLADQLWWLGISARKVRCDDLADAVVGRLDPPWSARMAMWAGVGHRALTGHTRGVWDVAALPMPDGTTLLASAGDDGSVRLWEPAHGEAVRELVDGRGAVRALAAIIMADGTTLVAAGGDDRIVRLWNPVTGAVVRTLIGHTGTVRTVIALPTSDGNTLLASAGDDTSIRLWDPVTARPVRNLTGHTRLVRALAALQATDGATLLASGGGDGSVRLWDPSSGAQLGWFTGPTRSINGLATVPMPDGSTQLASAGNDRMVRLWVGTVEVHTLIGHTDWVKAVTTVPTSHGTQLASAGDDGPVRLWDPVVGAQLRELTGHTGSVNSLTAVPMPDGVTHVASAGDDGSIRLWNPIASLRNPRLTGHPKGVRAVVAVSTPDGSSQLASAGEDRTIRLWDLRGGDLVRTLTGHSDWVQALASVPLPDDGSVLASGSDDGTVRLWDVATGDEVLRLTSHGGWVQALATVPDAGGGALLASADNRGSVRLWDPVTGAEVRTLTGRTHRVRAMAAVALPDGSTLLASGSDDGALRLWDPATGTQTRELAGHPRAVRAVAALPMPDGQMLLASAGDDGALRLWDPATGAHVGEFAATGAVRAMAALPQGDGGTWLALGTADHAVQLWDPATVDPRGQPSGHTLTGHMGCVQALAAVPTDDGGALLASGGADAAVIVWAPRR